VEAMQYGVSALSEALANTRLLEISRSKSAWAASAVNCGSEADRKGPQRAILHRKSRSGRSRSQSHPGKIVAATSRNAGI